MYLQNKIISFVLYCIAVFNVTLLPPEFARGDDDPSKGFKQAVDASHIAARQLAKHLLNVKLQEAMRDLINSDSQSSALMKELTAEGKGGSAAQMNQLMEDIRAYGVNSPTANQDINQLLVLRREQFQKLYDRVLTAMAQGQDIQGQANVVSKSLHQMKSKMETICKSGDSMAPGSVVFPTFTTPSPRIDFGFQILLGNNGASGFQMTATPITAKGNSDLPQYQAAAGTIAFAATYGLLGGTTTGVVLASGAAAGLGTTLLVVAAACIAAAVVVAIIAVIAYEISMGEAIDESHEVSNGMMHYFKNVATETDVRRYFQEECHKILYVFNDVDSVVTGLENNDPAAKTKAKDIMDTENAKIQTLMTSFMAIDQQTSIAAAKAGINPERPLSQQTPEAQAAYKRLLDENPIMKEEMKKLDAINPDDLARMLLSVAFELGGKNSEVIHYISSYGLGALNAIKTTGFDKLVSVVRSSYLASFSERYPHAMAVLKNDLALSEKLQNIRIRTDDLIAKSIRALFDGGAIAEYRSGLSTIERELRGLSSQASSLDGKAEINGLASSIHSIIGVLE